MEHDVKGKSFEKLWAFMLMQIVKLYINMNILVLFIYSFINLMD